MDDLTLNPRFAETYRRLGQVRLNPRRHTADNALAHSEAVARRAGALARANGCSDAEVRLLENLGRAHDIGKVTGTAKPERSLVVLDECGVTDAPFLALVRWHDTSLPWWNSKSKGQPPSDKAWRRLANEVDLRLLCLFMVADRVDAPPGWRRNAPTRWFLDEARARGLVGDLRLDLPDHPGEISAGAAAARVRAGAPEVLVIRVRAEAWELPKGGIEWDELPEEAAVRELREEAGVDGPLIAGAELGHVDYLVEERLERARYFRVPADGLSEGPLPGRTHERRWLGHADAVALPLVNEELRPLILAALAQSTSSR